MYGLSSSLVADLVANYSVLLYGAENRTDISRLRVVWPALLSLAALASTRARCAAPDDERGGAHIFVHPPTNFLARNALWVHQPSARLAPPPADFEWAEVVHCRYDGEGVSERTPMWFLAAPGSGLSLNVGRSLRLDTTRDDPAAKRAHRALTRGDVEDARAALLARANLDDYDSVHFPLNGAPTWRAERFTEIVMLRWLGEREFVTSNLTRFRCGRAPFLRACAPDDAAARQQGGACARPMAAQPALALVLNASRCTQRLRHATKVDAHNERLADAEEAAFRKSVAVGRTASRRSSRSGFPEV